MISVYESNETSFVSNGIKILKPIKALIYKQDNGEYYLDLKDSIDNFEYYQSGNITRVPTPWANSASELKMYRFKTIKLRLGLIICSMMQKIISSQILMLWNGTATMLWTT